MSEKTQLKQVAREIFGTALAGVDAGRALFETVRLDGARLSIRDTVFDLSARQRNVYALAIGKAALPMAVALDKILGPKICGGLIVGSNAFENSGAFNQVWHFIEGSHPLPDESSLRAAQLAFALLHRANRERALLIFLISGGGSAMIEWPRDERVNLAELREANRVLVSCGASINEINAVRRAFSAIKGGGLAARAPDAEQVTLIISDTGKGEESIVASGPTLNPPTDAPDAANVIARYNLAEKLPAAILRAACQKEDERKESFARRQAREHYVLLDNETALQAAAAEARRRGFTVEVAQDISEQPIAGGCALMLSRLHALQERAAQARGFACLISGGEFACPVNGDGTGGRNSETVLRCAIEIGEREKKETGHMRLAVLSAGTDGIDGNSPAAGAVADEETIARALEVKLDARDFLSRSDAYSFFDSLGDALITGRTGTNVRDLRIMLAEAFPRH